VDQFVKWRERLQLAPDVKTVEAVMRDYVGTIRPVLAALPGDCSGMLQGDFDIQTAAVSLLQEELRFRGSPELGALLHEITYTFASAAVRITLLHVNSTSPVA
jgi:hypothetical protein